jgi:hypothetical protein
VDLEQYQQAGVTTAVFLMGHTNCQVEWALLQDSYVRWVMIKSSGGLVPGTASFSSKWRQMAQNPGFGEAQHEFIRKTHYTPQLTFLKNRGIDLSNRGPGVQDAIWSTSVQFGPNSSLILRALEGMDTKQASDEEVISAIQDHKIRNNNTLFRSSSPAVRASTLQRARSEKADLIALNNKFKAELASNTDPIPEKPPAIQLVDTIIDQIQRIRVLAMLVWARVTG